jgi:hypothetical protein
MYEGLAKFKLGIPDPIKEEKEAKKKKEEQKLKAQGKEKKDEKKKKSVDITETFESPVGKAWSDAFMENSTMVHIDISHNNFKQHEMVTMSKFEN